MKPEERILVIPAAGRGSRLGGERPKALVAVGGRPMLDRLLDLYAPYVSRATVIVSPSAAAAVSSHLAERRAPIVELIEQPAPTGMLDAILLAQPSVEASPARRIWITWVDQVAVRPETLARMEAIESRESDTAIVLPTVTRRSPYTHLQREPGGRIVAILHAREGDVMPVEGESEMGVFSVLRAAFLRDLAAFAAAPVAKGASTGERNFLPFIPWMSARARVVTFPCTEEIEAVGINTPEELAAIERHLATRRR